MRFTRSLFAYFAKNFFAPIGILMTIYNLCKLGFSSLSEHSSIIFLIIILISLIWAFKSSYKSKKISLKINKRTKFKIFYGDLFSSNGAQVIPVNDYFDTHLGSGIVSERTVHGIFLSRFNGRLDDLRNKIDKELSKLDIQPEEHKRKLVSNLPTKSYPLGTCIRIIDGQQTYILVALTRFNNNEHVDVHDSEYLGIMCKMFEGINQLNNALPVYFPLFGSGQSGFALTDMQLIHLMLQAAKMAERISVVSGLNLVLYSKNGTDKSINLRLIENSIKSWDLL